MQITYDLRDPDKIKIMDSLIREFPALIDDCDFDESDSDDVIVDSLITEIEKYRFKQGIKRKQKQ